MNQQQNSYMPITERVMRGQFNQNSVATILIAGYVGIAAWLFFASRGGESFNRIALSTFIFMLLGVAWWSQAMGTQSKVIPWQRLAAQTGLQCIVGGFWTSYAVTIQGAYRKRTLRMYTRHLGQSTEVTRIELDIPNNKQIELKIRGPFTEKEIQHSIITLHMLGEVTTQEAGAQSHFLFGSNSPTAIKTVQSDKVWWSEAARLQQITTIEFEQSTLVFEQIGLLRDVGKLHMIYDLLSDLADTIEQD